LVQLIQSLQAPPLLPDHQEFQKDQGIQEYQEHQRVPEHQQCRVLRLVQLYQENLVLQADLIRQIYRDLPENRLVLVHQQLQLFLPDRLVL